jgi:hypothetical protein
MQRHKRSHVSYQRTDLENHLQVSLVQEQEPTLALEYLSDSSQSKKEGTHIRKFGDRSIQVNEEKNTRIIIKRSPFLVHTLSKSRRCMLQLLFEHLMIYPNKNPRGNVKNAEGES